MLKQTAARAAQLYRPVRTMLGLELHSPVRPRRPDLWRRGFLSKVAECYDLDRYDLDLYLSDWERQWLSGRINGAMAPMLNNKLFFHEALLRHVEKDLPACLAIVVRGSLYVRPEAGLGPAGPGLPDLSLILGSWPSIVVKPISDGLGNDVHALVSTPTGVTLDGRDITASALIQFQAGLGAHMVQEHLQQANYGHEIFPGSTNTVRLLTMQDSQTRPFIAAAFHRFGRERSAPVDNGDKGGLVADLDVETGTLGRAGIMVADEPFALISAHPETGAPIEGVALPSWDEAKALVLHLCDLFPYLRYVGWDLVLTEHGPKVLEGNTQTAVQGYQMHRPLLADERVRDFYQRNDALSRNLRKTDG